MEISQYHIFVSGKVQGVGFRFRTRIKAKQLNLTGWVKNLTDGRVEIIVQGKKEDLDKLLEWIKSQPAFSKIKKTVFFQEPIKEEFNDFLIKYDFDY